MVKAKGLVHTVCVPVAAVTLTSGFPWRAVHAVVPILCPGKQRCLLLVPGPDQSLKQPFPRLRIWTGPRPKAPCPLVPPWCPQPCLSHANLSA